MRAQRAIAGLAFLALAATAHAGTELALSGPEVAVGDGATSVVLRVAGAPSGANKLTVTTSGGLIGAIAEDGEIVRVVFVPPRVAVATEIEITASVRGQRASLVLAITPPVGAAPRAGGTGPLALTVPTRLVLGQDATTEITLRPPAGKDVRIVASLGTLGVPERDAAGVIHVAYTPPPQRAPARAVIGAVTIDGSEGEVASIALHGVGQVDARSKPGLGVTVRVGDTVFGPFRADARGRTRMAVLVPPGIQAAIAVARGGRESTLPLAAPPSSRIALACVADRVVTFTVDPAGAPVGATTRLTAASGTPTDSATLAPGVVTTRIAPAAGAIADAPVTVTAELTGDPTSIARCESTVPGVDPDGWSVVVDRAALVAGQPATVTLIPRYPGTRPHRRLEPSVVVDRGVLSGLATDGAGAITARWTLEQLAGATAASVTASSDGAPVATARVAVAPGPIARLALDPPAHRLVADGGSATRIAVHAWDRFGNPAPVDHVDVTARGRVLVVAGGVLYHPPLAHAALTDRVVATDPATGTSVAIELALVPARRALAVGLRGGYFSSLGGVAAPAVALDAGVRLPFAGRRIVLGAEAGWYAADRRVDGAVEDVDVAITVVPVMARATYGIELGRASIYAGVAGGVVFSRAQTMSASTGMNVEAQTTPVIAGMLGLELGIGPGRAVIEAGYDRVAVDGELVRGNLGGLHLTAGFRVER